MIRKYRQDFVNELFDLKADFDKATSSNDD